MICYLRKKERDAERCGYHWSLVGASVCVSVSADDCCFLIKANHCVRSLTTNQIGLAMVDFNLKSFSCQYNYIMVLIAAQNSASMTYLCISF